MVVVLPAPFGPIIPNTEPVSTLKSTPCSTSRRPNFLVRDRVEIAWAMTPPVFGSQRLMPLR